MDRRFSAEEWLNLSAQERIRRCTVLAKEAQKLAENASEEMRNGYLGLAKQWLQLGEDIAREHPENSN